METVELTTRPTWRGHQQTNEYLTGKLAERWPGIAFTLPLDPVNAAYIYATQGGLVPPSWVQEQLDGDGFPPPIYTSHTTDHT